MIPACHVLDLTRRYSEPHRYFHTLEHVAGMLYRGRELDPSDEQVYAIWYHDAIYDTRSETNEADSAELATEALRSIGWEETRIEQVAHMILDTKRHEPTIPEAAMVIDLDLSSIASDWDVYERNGKNIRREYHWASDAEFDATTRGFLERLLSRDRIFMTDWGAGLESKARENLERALRELP